MSDINEILISALIKAGWEVQLESDMETYLTDVFYKMLAPELVKALGDAGYEIKERGDQPPA